MNVAMAGLLVALKSNKDLQDSFFPSSARNYRATRPCSRRAARTRLSTKLAGLNVIEFGPGPGTTFKCFEKGGAPRSWVGIEPNAHFREMQDEAAKSLDESMIRSTRWYKAETLELDVASGTFDAAYFTHVLCSVEDPSMVLQQAARALKPGGTLLLMEPRRGGGRHLVTIGTEDAGADPRDRGQRPPVARHREDLESVLGLRGFEGRAFSGTPMPLPFRPHISRRRRNGR